jgi:RND family efflux transporter MFP subunit
MSSEMPRRRRIGPVVLLCALFFGALGLAAGYLIGHRSASGESHEEKSAEDKPTAGAAGAEEDKVASVRTAPVRRGSIARTIHAYGPVVARAGASRVVSAAFETRVLQVLVVAGQHVDAGAPLIRVEASPESKLQIAEARRVLAAAEADRKQVQSRADLKLATNQDLSTAQQAVDAAKLKLDSLLARGAGEAGPHEFKAELAGIVSAVASQPGQLVAAGAPLAEVVPADQIEIRLGIAPADVRGVAPGQAVKLRPVGLSIAEPIVGHVRLVSEKVSPDTRLVDVFVVPAAAARLVLEEYVDAELAQPQREGLLVPRSAVLPDEDGHVLFTVKDGRAERHAVTLLADDNRDALFEARDVAEGDEAVVLGNFELEDHMKVAARRETSEPASEPAAESASGPTSAPASAPSREPAR